MCRSPADLKRALREIVVLARTGDYGDAASRLNLALQDVSTLLRSGTGEPRATAKLAYSLETMVLMQTQGDWVALADVIEYEFIALLQQALAPGTTNAT